MNGCGMTDAGGGGMSGGLSMAVTSGISNGKSLNYRLMSNF